MVSFKVAVYLAMALPISTQQLPTLISPAPAVCLSLCTPPYHEWKALVRSRGYEGGREKLCKEHSVYLEGVSTCMRCIDSNARLSLEDWGILVSGHWWKFMTACWSPICEVEGRSGDPEDICYDPSI